MKTIRFEPAVASQIRAIPQPAAIEILQAIHRYAENGVGHVKPLLGEFHGFLRLRVGNYRVTFQETTANRHHPPGRRPARSIPLTAS